jgi:hypothetical protein
LLLTISNGGFVLDNFSKQPGPLNLTKIIFIFFVR